MHGNATQAILYVLVGIFVIVRFLMRELRERHLSNVQLFVLPGILFFIWLFLTIAASATRHPDIAELGIRSAIALPFGAIVGFAIAHFTTVRIGADGKIFFRGSYVTVAIWIAALGLRVGARFAFPTTNHSAASALASGASLVLLAFVASALVRALVFFKARGERQRASALSETAI